MQNKWNARTITCLVLTVLYFLGLILMLTGSLVAGVALWGASTVAGMGVLYYIKKQDKEKQEQEEKGEE